MADGKWITGLTPDTPVEEAGRAVLAARLAAVRDRLGPAAGEADDDAEHVHQLRVATRRAGAALRIFRDFLPKRRHKDAKATLRAVRRAAGDARDWDVFLDLVLGSEALQTAGAESAADFLAGYAFGERSAAQIVLVAVADAQAEPLRLLAEYLPGAVERPEDRPTPATLGGLAPQVLGGLFAGFAAAIDAGPRTPDELHSLRITAKRVRYAMEVFAGCFGPPFREVLYPAVERVQSILGAVQDGSVALARLKEILPRVRRASAPLAARLRSGFAEFTRETRQRIRSEKQAFRGWVREWAELTAAHPLPELLGRPPSGNTFFGRADRSCRSGCA